MNKNSEKKFFSILNKVDDHTFRLIIALITLFVVASVTKTEMFLSFPNFLSILKQLSGYGLMALGVSIAMISGGIDLSIVYISNLSAVCAGLFMEKYATSATGTKQVFYIIVAVFIALLIGYLAGALNGFLITKLNIPAMLATLGTMQLYMGISIILTNGGLVSGMPQVYTQLGRIVFFDFIPLSFVVYFIAVLIVGFIISKTTLGAKLFLIGTNYKAAKFSGIKVNKVTINAYIISGVVASIAGLLSLATLGSAKADFGSSFVLLTILIAVLGGLNPDGGKGNIFSVFIATLIVQFMSSYLNMFPSLSNFYRDLIWGAALIIVMIVNYYLAKRRQAELMRLSQ